MANINTTARPKSVTAQAATIYNLSMPSAATEYSQALSNATKKIMIRMRVKAEAKIAFVSGQSGTLYITIKPGCVFYEENLNLEGVTIYLQSSAALQTAEILEWT